MDMHADLIHVFMWMWRYTAYRFVFLIRTILYSHFIHMTAIILIVVRRQNPYTYGWRVYFKTRLFTNRPDEPGKDQSWVTCLFVYSSPFLLVENDPLPLLVKLLCC